MFDNKEIYKLSLGRGSASASEPTPTDTEPECADFEHSSVLSFARYVPSSLTLDVFFKSGKAYRYEGVEPWVFGSFIKAESPGQFYTYEIKGHYPCQKLL